MKELGIYIHIPFCVKKCDYCDFVSYSNKDLLIGEYIKSILIEIDKTNIDNSKYNITTIYIGGGTPSYIDSTYISDIIKKIKNKFKINSFKSIEVTIEINPGTVDEEKLKTYYNLEINRLSIGMQSSKNELLKEIGRIHTYEEFLKTYNMARKIGFKNINIDNIIGLPNQNLLDIKKQIKELLKLKPNHISIYSLTIEENTKLKDKIDNGKLFLPDEKEERKMYWIFKKELEKKGYLHYEISNFAKKGYESKHNLNCWGQKEYIGYGVAAHSYIDNKRYSNTNNIKQYIGNISNNKEKYQTINEEQNIESKMKEYMLLGLRKIEGVKISEFKNLFVENPIYKYKEILNELIEKKLIRYRFK